MYNWIDKELSTVETMVIIICIAVVVVFIAFFFDKKHKI